MIKMRPWSLCDKIETLEFRDLKLGFHLSPPPWDGHSDSDENFPN